MVANAGVYGMRQLAKMGIVISEDVVVDNASTTIAEMGDIVIDLVDGDVHLVDSTTKTQVITK